MQRAAWMRRLPAARNISTMRRTLTRPEDSSASAGKLRIGTLTKTQLSSTHLPTQRTWSRKIRRRNETEWRVATVLRVQIRVQRARASCLLAQVPTLSRQCSLAACCPLTPNREERCKLTCRKSSMYRKFKRSPHSLSARLSRSTPSTPSKTITSLCP